MIMANGHGGARPGSGRKKRPLADKILEDSTRKHRPKVLNMPNPEDSLLPEAPDYLRTMVATGVSNDVPGMKVIFDETVKWLEGTKCLHLINPHHITEYSILTTRWLECEDVVSKSIFWRSKKDGELMPNPLSDQALRYWKAADAAWDKIWRIVAQNCEENFGGHNPHDDLMEKLIRMNMER